MTIKVRDANVSQTAVAIKPFHLGVLRSARTVKVYQGGALHTVFVSSGSLTVSASPGAQTAITSTFTATSAPVTATPSGGTGPYTYSWGLLGYTGATPTITNPAFATTSFQQSGLAVDDFNVANFTCTVTDSLGATGSVGVFVEFSRQSGV